MWVRMLIEQHPDRKYRYLHIYLKMYTRSNIFFNVQVTAFWKVMSDYKVYQKIIGIYDKVYKKSIGI